ncbi:hypothetical protein LCM20_06375 [Halobacillus litoralis]|uniref:hypothetical protein n=1 Tax=Halobacillus litoralis TaxID=45668 RepID=UPI001CD4BA45|nr:hypothetical protein [Halobacillus litoralis]MCA0970206.1 hypothetical protein [Halobacillus litoralis]
MWKAASVLMALSVGFSGGTAVNEDLAEVETDGQRTLVIGEALYENGLQPLPEVEIEPIEPLPVPGEESLDLLPLR